MKWRFSAVWKPRPEWVLGTALLASVAWFLTTLLVHDLLKRVLGLPADAGVRDGHQSMMIPYLLPLIIPVPCVAVSALYTVEKWWRAQHEWRARLTYGALSLALLFWCQWSLRTNLSYEKGNFFHGYGVPTDTVQAAAYASICFPFALACGCWMVALLRRPITVD